MGRVVEAELKLKYKEAVKNLDEFQKEFSKVEKDLESANKKLEQNEKSAGGFSKGIRGIGTAFKAAGIGIVVALFAALAKALSQNQQVLDAVAIATGTISQVFAEVANVLVSVFNNVSSATENFDALGRVVKNLVTIAFTPLKLTFNAIKAAIFGAQLAWEQSWLGGNDPQRIAELKQELSDIKENVIEIGTEGIQASANIIKDFGEAVDEVSNISSQVVEGVSKINIKAITENVKANEQLKKSAALARVANQGLIEEFDRLAEKQRQLRDDDRKGINERIEANEKLLEHLENQKEKMLENAKAIEAQAQAQFDLSGKDEDNIRLQEAKNELKAVEAQIEGFMSEQKSNAVALEKELNELEISGLQNKAELQKVERDFKAEMIENDVLRLEQMKKNLKEEEELETKRLQNKINSFQEGTQAQQDAQQELDLFLKESGNNQKKIDKELGLAKENQTKETLGNLATIVGQNSKFGKAIAVVQAIQDTFAGANKALAQGGIFGFVGAAAVIAAGIANVKNITSTQTPKPPASLGARSTGGDTSVPVPATTSSLPPQFNTIGASGTNQLADLLGNQPPPRAFVVSGDVSTAQELDRNIVTSASLG